MANYVKLKCIDCNFEKIVEIPADGILRCPKCGHIAVSPSPKGTLALKVESIINLYGKQILDDLPRFCDLLEDALAQAGYVLYAWEVDYINDLRNNPQKYSNISTATQQDYDCFNKNILTEAIYETLGIETVTKRERGIAYVPPTPPIPSVPASYGNFSPSPTPQTKPKAKPTPPPTPKPVSTPKPAPTQTPVASQNANPMLKRFVLPKGKTAKVNCTVEDSISGWDKGRYVVCFRSGYPCVTGENPKDAVLEISHWGSSGTVTIKAGYLHNVRRISATIRTFSPSDLMVEFTDGTPSLLVRVHRSERKELDKLLEIARYNGRS